MSDINLSLFNTTAPGLASAPVVATTDKLLAICGMLDTYALWYAIGGFVVSLLAIGYFGRFRAWLVFKGEDAAVAFADKFLLVMIALLYAGVIVRLLRAG